MAEEPVSQLSQILDAGRNIKLARGVIGKTGHVVLATVGIWALILWRWSGNLAVDGGLLGVGLVVTAFTAWWIRGSQKFAKENPAQAMLEGAEFLEYRRIEMGTKDIGSLKGPQMLAESEDNG